MQFEHRQSGIIAELATRTVAVFATADGEICDVVFVGDFVGRCGAGVALGPEDEVGFPLRDVLVADGDRVIRASEGLACSLRQKRPGYRMGVVVGEHDDGLRAGEC